MGLGHSVGAQLGSANLLGPVELGGHLRQCTAPLPAARETLYRQALAPCHPSWVLAKAWALPSAQRGLVWLETQPAEARGEGSSGGTAPLCPQPPHLAEGGEQPPTCQHKREPRSGMRAAPGNGACTCLCKHASRFIAVWGPLCAAVLTSRGPWVTACLHRHEPTSLEASVLDLWQGLGAG